MNGRLESENRLVISYLGLRQTIGVLGTLLPFILVAGALIFFGTGIQSSISSYYHTGMGDAFVGILCTIGFFLFSYKGYTKVDDRVGDAACVCALGVAFFPTTAGQTGVVATGLVGTIHLLFATSLFLLLATYCLALFTKTDPSKAMTRQKRRRNKVYRSCGYTILACIALIATYFFLPERTKLTLEASKPVFWLEAIAIVAFGVSWLVKGEAILKDEGGVT